MVNAVTAIDDTRHLQGALPGLDNGVITPDHIFQWCTAQSNHYAEVGATAKHIPPFVATVLNKRNKKILTK
jgi:hypothetical protein